MHSAYIISSNALKTSKKKSEPVYILEKVAALTMTIAFRTVQTSPNIKILALTLKQGQSRRIARNRI